MAEAGDMDTRREPGRAPGVERDIRRVATRLERLRRQWRVLREQEKQLRTELHTLGIDPESVPGQTVREVAAALPGWREHPATDSQLRTLARLAAETDGSFVVGETMTKGQAHDLIAAVLAGNIPAAQIRDRPAGPLFMFIPVGTPVTRKADVDVPQPVPVPDPLDGIAPYSWVGPLHTPDVFGRVSAPDPEADAAVNSLGNRPDRFFSWADGHFKVKAQIVLADVMIDRRSTPDGPFVVSRALLADPETWGEHSHLAAEAYWESHTGRPAQNPITAEVVTAIVDARAGSARDPARDFTAGDFLGAAQAVLDAQEPAEFDTAEQRSEHIDAVQDGIDRAATSEVDQWRLRGRIAYDPADPLVLPHPDVDPQVAAAINAVRNDRARVEIRHHWFNGVSQAQREATASEAAALIAEVAVDPRLIAKVEGRRPAHLKAAAHHDAESLIVDVALETSPLRQAAAHALLEAHTLPDELFERAHAEWARLHGQEPDWDEATAGEWRAWMTMQLRRDPLVGSWAGMPLPTHAPMIEIGISTAFEVMAEERPDLIAATAQISRERLAAELRGNIIPSLPQPETSDVSALFAYAGGYCALRSNGDAESAVRCYAVLGWDYTLDGWRSSTTCGRNPRVAIGALLAARKMPIPDWIGRVYGPYARARAIVRTRAVAYGQNNEFYHAAARSDRLWKNRDSGSFAWHHPLIRDVRRGIIDRLRRDFPAETGLLDSLGLDLDHTLAHDVDPQVLRDIREAGDERDSLAPTDVTFGIGERVLVGDPEGHHITIVSGWAASGRRRVVYVDGRPRPGSTLRDAIADAHATLASEPHTEL